MKSSANALQLTKLVRNRKVLFLGRDAHRLHNRKSLLYKRTKKAIYETFASKPYPKWMRHYELTATPIESTPEGQYYCVRLINPPLLGSRAEFKANFVAYESQWEEFLSFHNLDKLEAKLSHMTHRVSRKDPEVAKMFPNVFRDQIYD